VGHWCQAQNVLPPSLLLCHPTAASTAPGRVILLVVLLWLERVVWGQGLPLLQSVTLLNELTLQCSLYKPPLVQEYFLMVNPR
jgi:hypothetical protein